MSSLSKALILRKMLLILTAFWGQANEAVLGSSNGNVTLSLPFNEQTVIFERVGADQINQINLVKAS